MATERLVLLALALAALVTQSVGFYSINYAADSQHPQVLNAGGSFLSAPTAEHVADVYARLSGHAPLFSTEAESLPTIDLLADRKEQPVILEVHGGSTFLNCCVFSGSLVSGALLTMALSLSFSHRPRIPPPPPPASVFTPYPQSCLMM